MGGEALGGKAYSPRMSSYPMAAPSSGAMASYTSNMMAPPAAQTQQQQFAATPGTCLLCYSPQVDVMLEPCHHQYHAHCIEQWQAKEKACPTCWAPTQNVRRLVPPQFAGMRAPDFGGKMQPQQPQQMEPGTPSAGAGSMVSELAVAAGGAAPAPAASAMRKGKWTAEESAYCDRLIEEFKKGNLPLAEGTTLRTFLSKLLNCDPMRISKKYTGDQCIGKIIFRRREDEISKEDMETIRKELAELEKTYLEREQYNQRRREKRLESELSRDKNRFMAARSMGYNNNNSNGATTPGGASGRPIPPQQQQQQQQQQQVPNAPPAPQYQNHSPHYAQQQQQQQQQASGRVQPPRHPMQAPPSSSSHLFNNDSNNITMLGIAGSQQHQQQQQRNDLHSDGTQSSVSGSTSSSMVTTSSSMSGSHQSDSFPRVSSIDSFSCLFPRVASIENFQMANNNNAAHHQSGFGGLSSIAASSGSSSGYGDTNSSGMVKNMSIGEGLNSYIPRIQSLEQLSHLLQEHAPPSPKSSGGASNSRDTNSNSDFSSRGIVDKRRAAAAEMQVKDEQSRVIDGDSNGQTGTKRLSPSGSHSSNGNQIQIPKPLSKMPRSSSGIFPRVPSLDKLPRVPSLDKLAQLGRVPSMDKLSQIGRVPSLDKIPRVASLDKLPRIPSMDKLHNAQSMERIPRVPSTDKLPRVPSLDRLGRVASSSDMLSRFGSSDQLSSFPSFSNLSGLSTSPSFDKLSALGGMKSNFPRNSSIEDILSLVASSENSGVPSGSHLQLSALAAVAGEESTHLAAAAAAATDRKRRMESAGAGDSSLVDAKKSRLSA